MDRISRIKFYFICCLVTLNGLFIGYAFGLNSRHVLIVDPNLPKYVKPVAVKPKVETETKTTTTTETKKVDSKGATHGVAGKTTHDGGKTGAKTGAKSDAKSGAKPDAKSGAKPDAKSGAKPDANSGSKPDAKSGSKPAAKSEAKPDVKPTHGSPSAKKSGDAKSSSKTVTTPSQAAN